MKMKKLTAVLMAATMGLTIYGCGSAAPAEAPAEAPAATESEAPAAEAPAAETTEAAGPVEITVTTTFAGEDSNAQNYKDAVAGWEAATGNTVSDTSATSDETFKTRIITDFETGSEPDVLFFFNGADANDFVNAGKVVSIDDIRAEFPEYAASKGGVVTYMKNTALRLAKYGATSNSISAGGVYTPLNAHIMDDPNLMEQCLDETLLHRWASAEEIAEFSYFLTNVNKSMTGQDILVDNGEQLKSNFIW